MSITPSSPLSPRSTSCAPRSSSNRDPNPIRGPSRSPRSPRPATSSQLLADQTGPRDAAKFDAALASHREALFAEWKQDHDTSDPTSQNCPPLPTNLEAFMRLVEAGWDDEAARRPHGQHTTVVVHVDVAQRAAALHLGPLLTDAERRYLTCDATCEVWFERAGQVIGAGRGEPGDQPPASPRPRAPPPPLRGPRLRGHPRFARPPHPALGRRRPDRIVQPGAGVPLSPPVTPPRRHHHHRTRRPSRRHRQRRPTTHRRITGTPTQPTPTRRPALPGTHRRTRRLVVVRPLPTTTTTKQLGWLSEPVVIGTVAKPKQAQAQRNSFAIPAAVGSR